MTRFVALLRNLNLGQRGHATTEQVLRAFADAGAAHAVSVRSNGTIVFEASRDDGALVAQRAAELLSAHAGVHREVFTVPLAIVREVVAEHATAIDVDRREYTVHGRATLEPDTPALIEAERRAKATVLDAGVGWAVILNHRERQSNGTPLIEFVLGVPATSRSISTLAMVCERYPASAEDHLDSAALHPHDS